jgi:hypothetical protein
VVAFTIVVIQRRLVRVEVHTAPALSATRR